MSSSPAGGNITIRPVANGAALQIELRESCLNFDVSDSLKSLLKEQVADYLEQGHRTFVLHLGAVSAIDSCGVGMLIALHHQVTAAGGLLAITDATPFVTKVLRVMRLDKFLALFPNAERALKSVALD